MFIKLDDIIPNRFQPREVFEEEALNKLADSIKRHGVIEPILVRPVSNKYEIIAGERRYKASVLAGLTKIPAIVKQMDDKESSIVAYIENEHRSDVSAIEEARTIDRILKNNNMTQEELARELGINQSTLANKLRLLSLPMIIQDSLMHNEISERHARSLLSVKDEAKQIELLNKIREKRMTVRELDSEIKSMNDNNMNYNTTNEYINSYPLNETMPNFASNYSMLNSNIAESNNMDSISDTSNNDFMNYLSNYDTTVQPTEPLQENSFSTENNSQNDMDFMNYLNNYDNTQPVNNTIDNTITNNQTEEDPSFMDFLNNYDNNNQFVEEENNNLDNIPSIPVNENSFNTPNVVNDNMYLNNDFGDFKDNNVVINDVNPPITSDFSNNSYIENNPNFVDVSQNIVIDNANEIINKLKVVVDDIKQNSKFKIDTDEIDYDDMYQITIKIDKRDF